jgi:Zn-finger nucleic acid-binding protein
VAYSVCGDCNGLFISEPQLYKFIQVETQSIAAARTFIGLLEDALAEDAPDGTHLRACPVCRADLERFGFGEHPMSIADRCPGGHGLWLDDGDLEKVVRCSRAVATVEGIAHGTTRLDDAPVSDSDETPMVCPNCQKQFPETETRCGDCNVSLFRS